MITTKSNGTAYTVLICLSIRFLSPAHAKMHDNIKYTTTISTMTTIALERLAYELKSSTAELTPEIASIAPWRSDLMPFNSCSMRSDVSRISTAVVYVEFMTYCVCGQYELLKLPMSAAVSWAVACASKYSSVANRAESTAWSTL